MMIWSIFFISYQKAFIVEDSPVNYDGGNAVITCSTSDYERLKVFKFSSDGGRCLNVSSLIFIRIQLRSSNTYYTVSPILVFRRRVRLIKDIVTCHSTSISEESDYQLFSCFDISSQSEKVTFQNEICNPLPQDNFFTILRT